MPDKTIFVDKEEIGARTARYWVEHYDGTENPARKWEYVGCDEHIANLCDRFMNNANIIAWGFTNKLDDSP